MEPPHSPPPYDAAADSARAAWASVAASQDAAHAAWASVAASQLATYASLAVAIVSIVVAVLAILNTSRLQENARKQHLSAAAIGVAHALEIYLNIIQLLGTYPTNKRADTRILLNMTKPARLALAQILSNSVDDTNLYRMGVNLQTALIVFEDEASYAESGKTTKNTNKDMLDCLNQLIEGAGNLDEELSAIRKRFDKDFRPAQNMPPAADPGE